MTNEPKTWRGLRRIGALALRTVTLGLVPRHVLVRFTVSRKEAAVRKALEIIPERPRDHAAVAQRHIVEMQRVGKKFEHARPTEVVRKGNRVVVTKRENLGESGVQVLKGDNGRATLGHFVTWLTTPAAGKEGGHREGQDYFMRDVVWIAHPREEGKVIFQFQFDRDCEENAEVEQAAIVGDGSLADFIDWAFTGVYVHVHVWANLRPDQREDENSPIHRLDVVECMARVTAQAETNLAFNHGGQRPYRLIKIDRPATDPTPKPAES